MPFTFERNKLYRFVNCAYPNKALNAYGTNTVATGRNVCLYTDDPDDIMQKWRYRETVNGDAFLASAVDANFVLDRSSGISGSPANNAHMCSLSQTSINDYALEFNFLSGNRCNIKLASQGNLLLTARNNGTPTSGTISSLAAPGNVYWYSTSVSNAAAQWYVEEVVTEQESTETTFGDGYYRFSDDDDKRYITENGSSGVTLSGIRTGGKDQFWRIINGKLKSEKQTSLGLSGNSSVTLSSNPANIEVIDASNNKCYIKNSDTGKYLYISSGSLIWSNNKTSWIIETVYKQTGVPVYSPEYFSSKSGMSNGVWETSKTTTLKKLFAKLYHVNESVVTDNNIGQCMFGAIYSAAYLTQEFRGKFHSGLDFTTGGGSTVYCPFEGIYLGQTPEHGCVYIYHPTLKCTFVFMHLEINSELETNIGKGENVGTNTKLGVESNTSPFSGLSEHLHVEIWNGESTSYASLPVYSYENFKSIYPYDKIAEIV